MTKKTQIKIIERMIENNTYLYMNTRHEDKDYAHDLLTEIRTFQICLNILTDKEFAHKMADIYVVE